MYVKDILGQMARSCLKVKLKQKACGKLMIRGHGPWSKEPASLYACKALEIRSV